MTSQATHVSCTAGPGPSSSVTTLIARFGLNPQVVAIMPMGSEASGSPTGAQWDGVALAIFVPRTVK